MTVERRQEKTGAKGVKSHSHATISPVYVLYFLFFPTECRVLNIKLIEDALHSLLIINARN